MKLISVKNAEEIAEDGCSTSGYETAYGDYIRLFPPGSPRGTFNHISTEEFIHKTVPLFLDVPYTDINFKKIKAGNLKSKIIKSAEKKFKCKDPFGDNGGHEQYEHEDFLTEGLRVVRKYLLDLELDKEDILNKLIRNSFSNTEEINSIEKTFMDMIEKDLFKVDRTCHSYETSDSVNTSCTKVLNSLDEFVKKFIKSNNNQFAFKDLLFNQFIPSFSEYGSVARGNKSLNQIANENGLDKFDINRTEFFGKIFSSILTTNYTEELNQNFESKFSEWVRGQYGFCIKVDEQDYNPEKISNFVINTSEEDIEKLKAEIGKGYLFRGNIQWSSIIRFKDVLTHETVSDERKNNFIKEIERPLKLLELNLIFRDLTKMFKEEKNPFKKIEISKRNTTDKNYIENRIISIEQAAELSFEALLELRHTRNFGIGNNLINREHPGALDICLNCFDRVMQEYTDLYNENSQTSHCTAKTHNIAKIVTSREKIRAKHMILIASDLLAKNRNQENLYSSKEAYTILLEQQKEMSSLSGSVEYVKKLTKLVSKIEKKYLNKR